MGKKETLKREVRLNPTTTVGELLQQMERLTQIYDGRSVKFSLEGNGEGHVLVNTDGCTWSPEYYWNHIAPEEPDVPPVWPEEGI